ncbi:MAG: hypothetical protein E7422_03015 [Ruminococcaceae bacterium]|jgi:hypothetical protein|nr:hypothetical protein [Oscillospiraceae bacterium]
MAKDLLKLPNNKKGFLILIALEALVAAWALAATYYAARVGSTGTLVYGGITVFAIFYILGRSLRGYRNIVRREKEERNEKKDGTE